MLQYEASTQYSFSRSDLKCHHYCTRDGCAEQYTLSFKKQKNAINVITRDGNIRSTFFASGWGIYIEVYGNNACFLTPRSELYYSVIYLNGTSMNIEQKTFVQQVEPPLWRIPVRKYSRSKRHYPTSVLERRRIRANSQGKNHERQ